MSKFACTRCGACCRETLYQAGDNIFGLYLEPSEVATFPAGVVFPLFGHGQPVEITAYQLGVNRCPNYEESANIGKCKVHANRPLVCRAFPVLGPSKVSPGCPGIGPIADGVDIDSLGSEIEAHRKKIECMMLRKETQWVWPLNKREWILLEKDHD